MNERLDKVERLCTTLIVVAVFQTIAIILQVLLLCAIACGSDLSTALDDYRKLDSETRKVIVYFGLQEVAPEERDSVAKILAFVTASCSTSVVLERQLPEAIPTDTGGNIYRIHLQQLGWEAGFKQVVKDYPYRLHSIPLFRADWFIEHVIDATESGTLYFQLLFGRAPENEADLIGLIGAVEGSQFSFGQIEGASRVAVNRIRWLENYPTPNRTSLWRTRDFAQLNAENDPLNRLVQQLAGDTKHDASEMIWGLPKILSSTGEMGILQGYALANGAGVIQEKAPANIVTDSLDPEKRCRGVEIVNFCSCVTCHTDGLNLPSRNELREYLRSLVQVDIAAGKPEKAIALGERIERFHLGNLLQLIVPWNESYAAMVKACNGLTTEENASKLISVIHEYDRPLTEQDAIRELGADMKVGELKIAVDWAKSKGYVVPERIDALAHGTPIPRDLWVANFRVAYNTVYGWLKDTGFKVDIEG